MAKHRKNTRAKRLTIALVAIVVATVVTSGTPSAAADDTTPTQVQQVQQPQPTRVTVVDRITPGTWHGLARAVAGWNRSPLVQLTISDHCNPGTYCVYVDAWDHGSADWMGLTTSLSDHMAHLQLNVHYAGNRRQQSATVCHELGHALGIGHPAPGAHFPHRHGCIASTNPALTTPVASHADRAALTTVGAQGWGALLAN